VLSQQPATHPVCGLDDHDVTAGLSQSVRRGQPCESSPHDNDIVHYTLLSHIYVCIHRAEAAVNPPIETQAGQASGVGETKGRLLEAAVRCIEERGYAATTARDLSTASGANLASIGYHFGSKEALLDEALVAASARWLEPIVDQARTSVTGSVRERIAGGLELFVESLQHNRATAVAFFEAITRVERSESVRSRLAEGYQQLRDAVVQAVLADQALKPAESDALASAVIALYDGVLVQWLLDPSRPLNVRKLVGTLGDSLCHR
jgi:AcrR family transcriptional regulator